VIWLGLKAGGDLAALAASIENALFPLGIQKETRAFAAHLTLGRLKAPSGVAGIQEILRRREPLEFGTFIASEFFLYESRLAQGGSMYRKIARFPFTADPARTSPSENLGSNNLPQ
jgi:2'-5' RNA ligase